MAAKFKIGQAVQQILPAPVAGTVKRFVLDEATGEIIYIIGWVADGVEQETAFNESQIKAQAE